MQPIYLIRHAPVAADLTIPSHRWMLSDEGRKLAHDLAALPVLTNLRAVYTSPEPKPRDGRTAGATLYDSTG